MKTKSIPAQPRADLSKAATKQLRRDGKVPAVMYGEGGEASTIVMDYADAKAVLFTSDTYIVQLDINGEVTEALVRESQYHPVTDRILHIDFLKVSPGKAVELVLPLKMVGAPVGVIQGGRLMPKLRKLKVKGIPSELPEYIEVDVTHLDLGMSVKVHELETGLTITSNASSAIASVEIPRALRSAGAVGEEGEETEETEAAAE